MVVGVGLILAWNQPFWPATPYGTWGILLLSHTCLLLPYPVRYVGAALAQIGPNLEAAARVHGASAARARCGASCCRWCCRRWRRPC